MISPDNPAAGSVVRIGIVPLCDCAPIAVAQETGIFRRNGLDVKISKELGWASVRDKIYYGELDAAQSIAGIAMALGLGIEKLQCEVIVPLILSLHGNAITLSKEFPHEQIGAGEGLNDYISRYWKKQRPLTLAVPHRHSSHHILLHQWLERHGVSKSHPIEVVFLPPPVMPSHLAAGLIDGYCVGEPWNSSAIFRESGWSPAVSVDLSHGHPEKALAVSGRFFRDHPEKTKLLVASLVEACGVCENPDFQEDLVSILSRREYVGIHQDVLKTSFSGAFEMGTGRIEKRPFYLFEGDRVNRPTLDKASWQMSGLRKLGVLEKVDQKLISTIHWEDVYERGFEHFQGG